MVHTGTGRCEGVARRHGTAIGGSGPGGGWDASATWTPAIGGHMPVRGVPPVRDEWVVFGRCAGPGAL